jgi:hypothetical protein
MSIQDIKEDIKNIDMKIQRAQTLGNLLKKTRTLFKDSKVRINFKSNHVILITESLQVISDQDCLKLQEFETQFYCNKLEVSITTKKKFCRYASQDHRCDYCPEDKASSTEESNSSEEDRDSSATR